jgi:hypothetical protein
MWKRKIEWATILVLVLIGTPLLTLSAEEIQGQAPKVLAGHMASYSGHLASFDGKQTVPVFENDVGRIFAVIQIEKMTGESQMKFLWFFKNYIMHDAVLPLKTNQMRVQSGFSVKPKWTGKWRVDVTSNDGTLLYSIPFIVRSKPDSIPVETSAQLNPNSELFPSPISTSAESPSVR